MTPPPQELWSAPPAALLLAMRERTLPAVADHLLGPALPVNLANTAPRKACHADFFASLC
jgi:hypothetical protein